MSKSKIHISFYRQKLLALLQVFGGQLDNRDLQKYLFLYTQLCQKNKSYYFVPYKYGCFSFQSYADRRKLIELGAIEPQEKNWQLASSHDFLSAISESDKKKLVQFKDKYSSLKGDNLIREVYVNYPYYAIKSEIADLLLSEEELVFIEAEKPKQKGYSFFTIGYEGKSFEEYLNQLIKNNVKLLCDVRKNPLSRKYGFSKGTLSKYLPILGIEYIHMPELGIVSEKRQELNTLSDYTRLFDEYEATTLCENTEAIEKLADLIKKNKRIAITCFEAEECMCHRGRVAKFLQELPDWKYKVEHI